MKAIRIVKSLLAGLILVGIGGEPAEAMLLDNSTSYTPNSYGSFGGGPSRGSPYLEDARYPLPACQFVLGFAAMHSLVPWQVGDCRDSQVFAGNGDSVQHTAGGLLMWRKADNWTAFTDGFHTWVNGPYGLQLRSNSERFTWESSMQDEDLPVRLATPTGASPLVAVQI